MDAKNRYRMVAGCLALLIALVAAAVPSSTVTASTPSKNTLTLAVDPTVCPLSVPMIAPMSAFTAVAAEQSLDGPTIRASRIWAAGWKVQYEDGSGSRPIGPYRTLIMRYDGKMWEPMSTPDMPGDNYLNAIAVRSATDAWGVGYFNSDGIDQPLVLHFDGNQWKFAQYSDPLMAPGAVSGRLTGIVVLNSPIQERTVTVAVGYKQFLGMSRPPVPMILIHDGRAWLNFAVPDLPLDSRVNSIAGSSLDDLWITASTYTNNGADVQGTLWHFDGTAWKLASQVSGTLSSVALSGNKVFAVGNSTLGTKSQTLAIVYDRSTRGTSWLKSSNTRLDQNYLTQVTAESSNVYAVGFAGNSNQESSLVPVVQRFDGSAFQPVASTSPTQMGRLSGAIYHNGNLWAVGDYKMDFDLRSPLLITTLCTTYR